MVFVLNDATVGKSCELTSPRFLSPSIEPSCILASAGHMHSLSHYKAREAGRQKRSFKDIIGCNLDHCRIE